jgi:hypothetical protein
LAEKVLNTVTIRRWRIECKATQEPGEIMANTMQNYLRFCFGQYREVARSKYHRDFDYQSIECRVNEELGLIDKRKLTCKDLRFFMDEARWPFGEFASLPTDEELSRALESKTFDFRHISSKGETNLIRELFAVLRSIDLVSIVLRFIRPDRYGVISPPVERILDLRRGSDAVQTYRYYLADLNKLKKVFGLDRIADVDMALWVLHEKCYGLESDQEIQSAYEMDPTFLDIRVNNLILPLAKVPNAKLAAALCRLKEKREVANLIACREFEALIREMTDNLHLALSDDRLEGIIKSLWERGHIDQRRRDNWKRLKEARNKFYHQDSLPSWEETRELMAEVEWLEQNIVRLKNEQR